MENPSFLVGAGTCSATLGEGCGAEASSGVDCFSAPAELRVLTVSGGNTNSLGGGVSVGGRHQLTLTRVSVTGNVAGTGGGGMFIAGTGAVTLNATTVTANTASLVGGEILNQGTLTVNTDSSITANSPDQCVNSAGGFGCP